ncbi:MAG: acyltransferase family protein [Phascolarctobacterium sp.]|nr:acyltransferase family protein [Phascolarctobacterium sp.]
MASTTKTKRVEYFDGLKLIMCYMIAALHFSLAFFPDGFLGYGSLYKEAEKIPAYLANLPASIFTNSTFYLYIFFALSAMIPTMAFYNGLASGKDPYKMLEKQAVKRYFRFVIPVVAINIITWGMHKWGMLSFKGMFEITGAPWLLAIETPEKPFWWVLRYSFVDCFFENTTALLTVLWCMYMIFLGYMLTLAFLALFGKSKLRFYIYAVSPFLFMLYPTYSSFFVGIVVGDLYVHCKAKLAEMTWMAWPLLIVGVAIGIVSNLGLALPDLLSPNYLNGISAGVCLLAVVLGTGMQKFLSWQPFVANAKYSFSVLLVHIHVMLIVASAIYPLCFSMLGAKVPAFWLTFLICIPIIHGCAIIFYRVFEQPSENLCNWVYEKLQEK